MSLLETLQSKLNAVKAQFSKQDTFLKPYNLARNEGNLVEELPYWRLASDCVLLKNGKAEFGFEITIPSLAMNDVSQVNNLHHQLTMLLRNAVPEGERLRLTVEVGAMRPDTLEQYARLRVSQNAAADSFDREKRSFLESKRLRHSLVEYRFFVSQTLSSGRRFKGQSFSPTELENFSKKLAEAKNKLSGALETAGLSARGLDGQDLFELMWRYLNPDLKLASAPEYEEQQLHLEHLFIEKHPHLAPNTLRSQLCESEVLRQSTQLKLGDTYLAIVSAANLPTGEVSLGEIGHLLNFPSRYNLIIDFVHEPLAATIRKLETQERKLRAAVTSSDSEHYTGPSVGVGARENREALEYQSSQNAHLVNVGISMVLLEQDQTKLRDSITKARQAFSKLSGMRSVHEGKGLWTQFKQLAPFSGSSNERLKMTFDTTAMCFFPYDVPWTGSKRPTLLLQNRYDSLTAIDPFDPANANWNAIVVGGSGSGKTFFTQTLLAELLREDADVMIVDRGYGYASLVELYGGTTIPIEPGTVSINPFQLAEGQAQPDEQKKAFLLAVLRAMLPTEKFSAQEALENALLTNALEQVYLQPKPRLSDFVAKLSTMTEVSGTAMGTEELALAKNLAIRLKTWCGDTPFGQLIDRETTVNVNSPIVYFESSGLDRYPALQGVAMLLMTDLIWRRVERDKQRKKIVVFDEAWAMLRIPEAAQFVVELYRRFRRYNAAVYSVTQSLEDFRSEQAKGILQNTTYHYLLRLPGEDESIQEILGLTPAAMTSFKDLTSVKGKYNEALAWIRREDSTTGGIIKIEPTPFEYWAFTTNANDMALRDTYLEKHSSLLAAIKALAIDFPNGAS